MRNFLLFTCIFLVLGTLGTFAWVSHNPDSPHLEAAQEWPVVGELARKVREAYLGPPRTETQISDSEEGDEDETENIILDLRGIQTNPDKDVVVYKKPEDLTEHERQVVDALEKRSEERLGPIGKPAATQGFTTNYTPPSLQTKLPVMASECSGSCRGSRCKRLRRRRPRCTTGCLRCRTCRCSFASAAG